MICFDKQNAVNVTCVTSEPWTSRGLTASALSLRMLSLSHEDTKVWLFKDERHMKREPSHCGLSQLSLDM